MNDSTIQSERWTNRWTAAMRAGWAFHLEADERVRVVNPQGQEVGHLPALTWNTLDEGHRCFDMWRIPQ